MHKNESLSWAHPIVQEWFQQQFSTPTDVQVQGWAAISLHQSTLISAPTGAGKTLAAFLTCIDQLVRQAIQGIEEGTQVIYISPLKALSNDIQKNLMQPLQAIFDLAKKKGIPMNPILVSVRTGDTTPRERQIMLKKPPHILVTTPESFYILLTAQKSREMLASIKTIIVDEIHAIADDKRGAHLTLSLERLEKIVKRPPVRIGLSATQKPIEEIAHFLVGNGRPLPTIINMGHRREMDLAILVPNSELGPVASNEMWEEIYDKLVVLIQENRSTLIFVNTRRLAERIAHHLAERIDPAFVAAHHGSLSKKLRHQAETKLKNGELKVLVATASLELGIDIGTVDLVNLIGSPRAISTALQRIGRSGHWYGAISKARFFVTTRDELIECAALLYAIRQGELDRLKIPMQPIDILAQQIVATCATEDWKESDLFNLVKRAYHYQSLSFEEFEKILNMLSDGIAGARGRYGTYLFRDRVNHIVRARRGSRLIAITNGGAIPENGLFTVIAEPNNMMVGTLDEDFAVESHRGDIILLGNTSWRIKRVENTGGRVLVEDAHSAPPSIPFWRGEAPARTDELSLQVSHLRKKISDLLPMPLPKNSSAVKDCITWIMQQCAVEKMGAEQLVEYIQMGRMVLGAVPTQETIIAERFFDESGGMQLVIHAPFGACINKAWGLALRKKFCRSFNLELQATATDNGLNIALTERHSFPLKDVFQFLHENTIHDVLVQAALQSPLFQSRWRWNAMRSLALPRFRYGKKTPPNIIRMLSEDLLTAIFPAATACQDNMPLNDLKLPDHPLVVETMKDIFTAALDVEGLAQILKKIHSGAISCLAVDTPIPSVFCHEIVNANPYAYLDDAPLEERRARAVEMRRLLPASILETVGKLDEKAISEVMQQAWPDIRNADELHDFLQTVIIYPTQYRDSTPWEIFFNELLDQGRVCQIKNGDYFSWIAIEKKQTIELIYPTICIENSPIHFANHPNNREEAIVSLLQGWLSCLGPTTCIELSQLLLLTQSDIEQALLKLENTGFVLRGHFRTTGTETLEWCERRLLARIHRLTIGRLRKEIKPVTAAQYMHWLLTWQHLAPRTQLRGEQGLIEIIRQLQGYELPAKAWEYAIFAKRVSDYHRDMLDKLCLMGIVGWGRLSPHTFMTQEQDKPFTPNSNAAITFFLREDYPYLISKENLHSNQEKILSHTAQKIQGYLTEKGASFFGDIVRNVSALPSEIETGLWELVSLGRITADSFDNLRAFIDPKRRLRKKDKNGFLYSSGRWSILAPSDHVDNHKQLEIICRILLNRYGVVFRDVLQKEKNIPRWRELLVAFRRLEDQGEIRGGRFVSGFLGEQFALPYVVDSLRASRNNSMTHEIITLSSQDPLNLTGIILPGERIPANTRQKIMLKEGEIIS